jgi:hypothetical protein
MADYGRRSMSGYTYGGSAGQYAANLVGGRLDPSGYIEVVDRTVEGTAVFSRSCERCQITVILTGCVFGYEIRFCNPWLSGFAC